MPLFEYRCKDCGAVLELLQKAGDIAPRRCGFRCVLPPGSDNDARAFGELERLASAFATPRRSVVIDSPDTRDAARVGLTSYANEGNGRLRRIDGDPSAPEIIDVGDIHSDP